MGPTVYRWRGLHWPSFSPLPNKGFLCKNAFHRFYNSLAFNTIIPKQLIQNLGQIDLNTSLCNWLLDFLSGRQQHIQHSPIKHPPLFILLTHDCATMDSTNYFIKFVVGLISNNDETNYRNEMFQLARWCSDNNLSLSECRENKGDCCGLSKSTHPVPFSAHQQCCCGEGEQHQVSGCVFHRWPLLDHQH